jgi:hypothetical protein
MSGFAVAATLLAAWLMATAGVGKRQLSWRPRKPRPPRWRRR